MYHYRPLAHWPVVSCVKKVTFLEQEPDQAAQPGGGGGAHAARHGGLGPCAMAGFLGKNQSLLLMAPMSVALAAGGTRGVLCRRKRQDSICRCADTQNCNVLSTT